MRSGIDKTLEEEADQILKDGAGETKTPWWTSGLMSPLRVDSYDNWKLVLIAPHAPVRYERSGIYTRTYNPVSFWLNSQPLILGGRRDLIRRTGEEVSISERYEDEGTYQQGRWDPWLCSMEFTTKRGEGERVRGRRRNKNRQGQQQDERPWSSSARG